MCAKRGEKEGRLEMEGGEERQVVYVCAVLFQWKERYAITTALPATVPPNYSILLLLVVKEMRTLLMTVTCVWACGSVCIEW